MLNLIIQSQINKGLLMELTSEEIITKILSKNEIINKDNDTKFVTNPDYNLGEFLENIKNSPSPYGEKYIFIK